MELTPAYKVEVKSNSIESDAILATGFYYTGDEDCNSRIDFLDHDNKRSGTFLYIKNDDIEVILNFMKTAGMMIHGN